MALEIDANPQIGPAFLRDGDQVLFRYVIDRSNIVGPRKATDADKDAHPGAWAAFEVEPLDHDGDGRRGGAPKGGNRRKAAS